MIVITPGKARNDMDVKRLILLSSVITGVMSVVYKDVIHFGKGNREKANYICKGERVHIPHLEAEEILYLDRQLRKYGIQSVWLRPKRTHFSTYKWLDGSELEEKTARMGKLLGFSCTVIDLNLGMYDFFPCEAPKLAFLCQFEDCESCQLIGRTDQSCLAKENQCYVLTCGAENWYSAKMSCRIMGGSLAQWKEEKKINLFKVIGVTENFDTCSNVWLGARLNDWSDTETASQWFWAKGEPRQNKDCSVLVRRGDKYHVESANCKEQHNIFCRNETKNILNIPVVGDPFASRGSTNGCCSRFRQYRVYIFLWYIIAFVIDAGYPTIMLSHW